MRFMLARSSVDGKAPVPKAALRLRSSTETLLPSQCRCIPLRLCCSQTEGKSEAPAISREGRVSSGKLSSTFAGGQVSTRPGPNGGSQSR